MAVVKTPAEGFNGTVAGVTFVDGHGDCDDESALAYFRRHGYTVTARKAAKKPAGGKSDEPAGHED